MLLFDDTNEHIERLINIGVKLMDIDCHDCDILVDYGYIDHDDDALAYVDHNPDENFYGLSISDKPGVMAEIAEIIAHELIHVKQYQSGRLKDIKPGLYKWEDEEIIFHSKLNPEQYWDLPWEKEAYSKQCFWATRILNRI